MNIKKIICGIVAVTTIVSCNEYLKKVAKENKETYIASLDQEYIDFAQVLPCVNPTDLNYSKISEDEFRKLSIFEMQNYIINTYNVNYFDLVDAITLKMANKTISDSEDIKFNLNSEAFKITRRDDFEEIRSLFNILFEAKFNYALEKENLNAEDLDTILESIIVYSKYSYDEGYLNMNLIENRTHSNYYVNLVSNEFFDGAGFNLYYQLIAKNQFEVYKNKKYQEYSANKLAYPSYYGAIDNIVYGISVHDYLNFTLPMFSTGTLLVENGNVYSNPIPLEDKIDSDDLTIKRAM